VTGDKGPPFPPGQTLVVCIDGPRAGAWYFADTTAGSWTDLRRLANFNGEDAYDGRTLGYVRTEAKIPHPRWPHIEGHVLAWAPGVADAAEQKRLGL
jgi:hypothetical protein